MSFFVIQSTSGVRKTGASEYQAFTDDPRFVYRFWLRRPRYMVVVLQALDESLDPKLYADRGNGFDEASSISLQHDGTCIYCISVTSPYRVAKIRIDPCSSEERFRYWAKCAWNEKELTEVLAEAKREAGGAHRSTMLWLMVVPRSANAEIHRKTLPNILPRSLRWRGVRRPRSIQP